MTNIVLVRHGRSTANAAGILAGRAEGVELDDVGRDQAEKLAVLLADVEIQAAYTSPVLRCRQTAELLGHPGAVVVEGLTECDYGQWTNRPLKDLAGEALWKQVQATPSAVTFPGGESMVAMRDRAVAAVADIAAKHSPGETVLVVSHGDPIKSILSHALNQSLDDFQRINVSPASVSIIVQLPGGTPFVACINAASDVSGMLRGPAKPVVGGGDVPEGEASA